MKMIKGYKAFYKGLINQFGEKYKFVQGYRLNREEIETLKNRFGRKVDNYVKYYQLNQKNIFKER